MIKKLFSALMICLCFVLASCGSNAPVSGEPAAYYNANKSFSIDLPTSNDKDWQISKQGGGDILNISNSSNTIRIQVQCLSKSKILNLASDFSAYQNYASENPFHEIFSVAEFQDTSADVPDFILDSAASDFTFKNAKGTVIFMESERCYYTYLIMAADEVYDSNADALLDSVVSLKEITELP